MILGKQKASTQFITGVRTFIHKRENLLAETLQKMEEERNQFHQQCEANIADYQKNHVYTNDETFQLLNQMMQETQQIYVNMQASITKSGAFFGALLRHPIVQIRTFELNHIFDCINAYNMMQEDLSKLDTPDTDVTGNRLNLQKSIQGFQKQIQQNANNIVMMTDMFQEQQLIKMKQEYGKQEYELKTRQEQYVHSLLEKFAIEFEKCMAEEKLIEIDEELSWMNGFGQINHTDQCYRDSVISVPGVYPLLPSIHYKELQEMAAKKFQKVMKDVLLFVPVSMPAVDGTAWMIQGSGIAAVHEFVHFCMLRAMTHVPCGKCRFIVGDSSISERSSLSLYTIYDKIPELFGSKISTGSEEISRRIEEVHNEVKNRINHREDELEYQFLILFDVPKGLDKNTLDKLLYIIQRGNACGIYTILTGADMNQPELSEIRESSMLIQQLSENERVFLIQENGLQMAAGKLQNGLEDRFMDLYKAYLCQKNSRTILFDPAIYEFMQAKKWNEISGYLSRFSKLEEQHRSYGKLEEKNNLFPTEMVLGRLFCTLDTIGDHEGIQQIIEVLGKDNTLNDGKKGIALPVTLGLQNNCNLYLECPENDNEQILTFANHVIWTYLTDMPISKLRICVFDGDKRGGSILPFLKFRKNCPDVFDDTIYTTTEAMHDKLVSLNHQIDQFIQEKMGQDFITFNQQSEKHMEAATLLVLYDFPRGMDPRNMELLKNILRNGNQCGIYTMICHNSDITFSTFDQREDHQKEIKDMCTTIRCQNKEYFIPSAGFQIMIPSAISDSEADAFMEAYTRKAEDMKKQGISFADIAPETLFAKKSSDRLCIPIGMGAQDTKVEMIMGEGSSHHGLIIGASGSGKSTLLHTIIMSSMLHYSPDELQLYLMDFKSGTEFKIYDPESGVRLPHIRLLALDTIQEFGLSILEELVQEMERRADLFKEASQSVSSIKEYVNVTEKKMPRILVIMDEFQILFNDGTNRKTTEKCVELLKRIVTEGRAYGIHLLMATQSMQEIPGSSAISKGMLEQMLRGDHIERSDYIEVDEDMTQDVEIKEQEAETKEPAGLFDFIDEFEMQLGMEQDASENQTMNAKDKINDRSVEMKLNEMIQNGYAYGIHFVISSLEYQCVKSCMFYGNNVLDKFTERMIYSLNADDAQNLINEANVAGLSDNTVYYSNGRESFQLKPFIAPKDAALQEYFTAK